MLLRTQYASQTADTRVMASPGVWGNCPYEDIFFKNVPGFVFFDDFIPYNEGDVLGWTEDNVTAGTVDPIDAEGGVIRLDAGGTTTDQGPQLMLGTGATGILGEFILPAAGTTIWYESRVKISNTVAEFFAGMSVSDTSLFATGENSSANHIGFEMGLADSGANPSKVQAVTESGGTRTKIANVKTLTSGSYVKFGFVVNGVSDVTYFVDGVPNGTKAAANIPTTEMTLIFAILSTAGVRPTLDIDWVRCAVKL